MPTLPRRPLLALTLYSLILPLGGCSHKTPSATAPPTTTSSRATVAQPAHRAATSESEASSLTETTAAQLPGESASACTNPQTVRLSEQNRANCYRLQPAKTVLTKQSSTQKGGKGKASKTATAAAKPTAKSSPKAVAVKGATKAPAKGSAASKTATTSKTTRNATTTAKKGGKHSSTSPSTAAPAPLVERTVGLCQPQSLIYARCRTGIKTCQMGDTSPVQWFACARKNGATTATPVAGSVIVIDTHRERNMDTGHPAYVEEAHRNDDGTWSLRISHTNYDRQCHLDLDAQVLFDPGTMTATFITGPWSPWAQQLRVLGFILR